MPNRRRTLSEVLKWVLLPGIVLAILMFAANEALARAGGGGGYHGGGGGGGGGGGYGGGGGGGGNGSGLIQLIFILFQYPIIGVPVLIVIAVLFYYGATEGNSTYQSGVIRRGGEAMRSGEKETAIAGVRDHDPNFDEVDFCRRVHLAFDKIQSAWCMQNVAMVRPFLSDGVHERFLIQFEEQKAQGYRDHMENIAVEWIDIVGVSSEGLFDEMTVRIRAAARDWRESLADGKRVSGSTSLEPFVEFWTFLRHRTATTEMGRTGLIEGNCPNCAAPIELNQSANCTHCKALLRSGAYDWVLTEITQQSEWAISRRAVLPGVGELRGRDPEFDTVSLEDRASVMFWRKAKADRTGKIDPLRKIASPEFSGDYAKRLKADAEKGRAFAGDCAVGGVKTLGVIPATDRDRAVVEVRWSGKRFIADPAGRIKNTGEDLWAATWFVLIRNANAKTNLGKSISSAHCPNCGAPENGGTSDACEFCGTVLNDGSREWVLEKVLSQNDPEANEWKAQWRGVAQAIPDPRILLAWLVKMATVDGNVDPCERGQLAQFAARWHVPAEQMEGMIGAGLRGDLVVSNPHDASEARGWMSALAAEAWADGKLTREEMELLRTVGVTAGLSEFDINQLVLAAKSRMLAEANAALRERRRG